MQKTKSFNVASITYFLIFMAFILLRMLSSFGLLSFNGSNYLFTVLIQVGFMLCGSLFLFSAFKKQKLKFTVAEFRVRKVSGKVILLSILAGALVYFINIFVANAFNGFIGILGYEHSSGSVISSYSFGTLMLDLIFTALLPAVCEEITHRGMLLHSLSPLGIWKAIIISAFAFGLLHLNIEQFFYATLIGVYLGVLTVSSSSIVPAMIVHFMNNALSSYFVFSRVNGLPLGKAFNWVSGLITSNVVIGVILSLMLIVVLGYFLFLVSRLILKKRTQEGMEEMRKIGKEIMKQAYMLDLEQAKLEATGEISEGYDPMQLLKSFIVMEDEEKFTPSKQSKVLLYVTLGVGLILTIFTFVWGAL